MITWKKHFLYQVDYQHWANDVLFGSLDRLDDETRNCMQGLFFGSIHHTLNHLLVGQLNWWARLKGEPAPHPLDTVLHEDWRGLKQALRQETRALQHWLEMQPEAWFEGSITYHNTQKHEFTSWVRDVLTHLMTHNAHHRGQISAVATRLGAPVPEMDFIYYKREMADHLEHLQQSRAAQP